LANVVVPDEERIRQFLNFFQFAFQSIGDFPIDPGPAGKNPQHNGAVPVCLYGPAKDAGVALVQDLKNPVIVDVLASFTDGGSTGRTGEDLFGQHEVARRTQFHGGVNIDVGMLVGTEFPVY
jgi:hypothetical protein